jgi:hypothetical protein
MFPSEYAVPESSFINDISRKQKDVPYLDALAKTKTAKMYWL